MVTVYEQYLVPLLFWNSNFCIVALSVSSAGAGTVLNSSREMQR